MEIVILSRNELLILWGLALTVPAAAHVIAHYIGKRLGVPPVRAIPRICLLTTATVTTLLLITGFRFASVEIGEEAATLTYAPPIARSHTIPLDAVEDVALRESAFPRRSYSIAIRSSNGEEFQSVGVTTSGLDALYRVFQAFRPGETPYVALK